MDEDNFDFVTASEWLSQLLAGLLGGDDNGMLAKALSSFAVPLLKSFTGNDVAWDTVLSSNRGAMGLFDNYRNRRIRQMQDSLAADYRQNQFRKNLQAIHKGLLSDDAYKRMQEANPELRGISYDSYINMLTDGRMSNRLVSWSYNWLSSMFPGVIDDAPRVGNALGQLAANITQSGMRSSDPASFAFGRYMADNLFAGDWEWNTDKGPVADKDLPPEYRQWNNEYLDKTLPTNDVLNYREWRKANPDKAADDYIRSQEAHSSQMRTSFDIVDGQLTNMSVDGTPVTDKRKQAAYLGLYADRLEVKARDALRNGGTQEQLSEAKAQLADANAYRQIAKELDAPAKPALGPVVPDKLAVDKARASSPEQMSSAQPGPSTGNIRTDGGKRTASFKYTNTYDDAGHVQRASWSYADNDKNETVEYTVKDGFIVDVKRNGQAVDNKEEAGKLVYDAARAEEAHAVNERNALGGSADVSTADSRNSVNAANELHSEYGDTRPQQTADATAQTPADATANALAQPRADISAEDIYKQLDNMKPAPEERAAELNAPAPQPAQPRADKDLADKETANALHALSFREEPQAPTTANDANGQRSDVKQSTISQTLPEQKFVDKDMYTRLENRIKQANDMYARANAADMRGDYASADRLRRIADNNWKGLERQYKTATSIGEMDGAYAVAKPASVQDKSSDEIRRTARVLEDTARRLQHKQETGWLRPEDTEKLDAIKQRATKLRTEADAKSPAQPSSMTEARPETGASPIGVAPEKPTAGIETGVGIEQNSKQQTRQNNNGQSDIGNALRELRLDNATQTGAPEAGGATAPSNSSAKGNLPEITSSEAYKVQTDWLNRELGANSGILPDGALDAALGQIASQLKLGDEATAMLKGHLLVKYSGNIPGNPDAARETIQQAQTTVDGTNVATGSAATLSESSAKESLDGMRVDAAAVPSGSETSSPADAGAQASGETGQEPPRTRSRSAATGASDGDVVAGPGQIPAKPGVHITRHVEEMWDDQATPATGGRPRVAPASSYAIADGRGGQPQVNTQARAENDSAYLMEPVDEQGNTANNAGRQESGKRVRRRSPAEILGAELRERASQIESEGERPAPGVYVNPDAEIQRLRQLADKISPPEGYIGYNAENGVFGAPVTKDVAKDISIIVRKSPEAKEAAEEFMRLTDIREKIAEQVIKNNAPDIGLIKERDALEEHIYGTTKERRFETLERRTPYVSWGSSNGQITHFVVDGMSVDDASEQAYWVRRNVRSDEMKLLNAYVYGNGDASSAEYRTLKQNIAKKLRLAGALEESDKYRDPRGQPRDIYNPVPETDAEVVADELYRIAYSSHGDKRKLGDVDVDPNGDLISPVQMDPTERILNLADKLSGSSEGGGAPELSNSEAKEIQRYLNRAKSNDQAKDAAKRIAENRSAASARVSGHTVSMDVAPDISWEMDSNRGEITKFTVDGEEISDTRERIKQLKKRVTVNEKNALKYEFMTNRTDEEERAYQDLKRSLRSDSELLTRLDPTVSRTRPAQMEDNLPKFKPDEEFTFIRKPNGEISGQFSKNYEFKSSDWGGLSKAGVAELAATISKDMDMFNGIDPTSDFGRKQAMERFRDTLRQYTEALGPLKSIMGDDTRKMVAAMEEITGQSFTSMSAGRVRNLATRLASATQSGAYSSQEFTGMLTDVTRSVAGMQGLSTWNYTNAAEQAMTAMDVWKGGGYHPEFLTDSQWRGFARELTTQTNNSTGADLFAKAYASWAENEKAKGTKREEITYENFSKEVQKEISLSGADPMLAARRVSHTLNNYQLDAAKGSEYYKEAVQSGWAGRFTREQLLVRETARDAMYARSNAGFKSWLGLDINSEQGAQRASEIYTNVIAAVTRNPNITKLRGEQLQQELDKYGISMSAETFTKAFGYMQTDEMMNKTVGKAMAMANENKAMEAKRNWEDRKAALDSLNENIFDRNQGFITLLKESSDKGWDTSRLIKFMEASSAAGQMKDTVGVRMLLDASGRLSSELFKDEEAVKGESAEEKKQREQRNTARAEQRSRFVSEIYNYSASSEGMSNLGFIQAQTDYEQAYAQLMKAPVEARSAIVDKMEEYAYLMLAYKDAGTDAVNRFLNTDRNITSTDEHGQTVTRKATTEDKVEMLKKFVTDSRNGTGAPLTERLKYEDMESRIQQYNSSEGVKREKVEKLWAEFRQSYNVDINKDGRVDMMEGMSQFTKHVKETYANDPEMLKAMGAMKSLMQDTEREGGNAAAVMQDNLEGVLRRLADLLDRIESNPSSLFTVTLFGNR